MKRCKRCGAAKALSDFYRDRAARDGHRPECKLCTSQRRKQWYAQNRDREIARVKSWQQANALRVNEVQRRNRAKPERKLALRNGHLKRTFGITNADYEWMLEAQGGGCAICGRPPRPDISLHVDHDHETGRIRGLTCFTCNNGVGQFGEKPEWLERAIDYLDAHDPEVEEMAELARKRAYALVGR